MKQKLLLHVCCGPCSLHVLQKLQADFAVSGFFYNPNIQPFAEYEFRRRELEKIADRFAWPMIWPDYDMREWFAAIRGLEREPERGGRCPVCFRFRLEKTFRYAREHGFVCVASTLSISPHKVTAQINSEGLALSQKYGVEFLPENFKKHDGFLNSRRQAQALGVRQQEYCGCVYSRVERLLRLRK